MLYFDIERAHIYYLYYDIQIQLDMRQVVEIQLINFQSIIGVKSITL